MEVAVTVIQAAGIRAVLARTFARSFYRNAINNGLVVIECDTSTINDDNVQIVIEPFYEEDEDFLAFPAEGNPNFQWQEPTNETSGEDLDFTMPTGTFSVQGSRLTWTKDSDVPFPDNTRVKLTLGAGVASLNGNTLGGRYRIDFCLMPCPYVVSVERVREEFFPYVLTAWTDDLIGRALWKNAIEAVDFMRYNLDLDKVNKTYREYVLMATVADIFEGLRIEDELLGGQFKRLGDMAIRYDVRGREHLPSKHAAAVKDAKDLKATLTRRYNGTLFAAVKGECHPSQRRISRTRLWKQDMLIALEGFYMGNKNMANTRDDRMTKVPGYLNRW